MTCAATDIYNEINAKGKNLAPIADILPLKFGLSFEKLEFCYQVAKKTIEAILSRRYSEFDAQTTSNCCHGMSLLVRGLILSTYNKDLQVIYSSLTEKTNAEQITPDFLIPKTLIELSQLYILNYIRTICPVKGVRTSASKLKSISQVGTAFCESIVKALQKKFSNQVALSYQNLLTNIDNSIKTCGIEIKCWGKYVSRQYLRSSSQEVLYAPCLYSMQVTLAYLISNQAKIAIINDIYNSKNELARQYISFLEGNGHDGFTVLKSPPSLDEIIIIFNGCCYTENPEYIISKLNSSIVQFSKLVLACDLFYPQFPKVSDDPNFNNSSIIPDEKNIKLVLEAYKNVKGVSIEDPSFYCLNHIFVASTEQILSKNIPTYKIPQKLLSLKSDLSK